MERVDKMTEFKDFPAKYDEPNLIKELHNYIAGTYGKHYVGKDNIQTLDLIFATGHGEGFTIGNMLKYASRWKQKKGEEYGDIMKVLHYGLLLLYLYKKEINEKQQIELDNKN
jgi:hypothetical protein